MSRLFLEPALLDATVQRTDSRLSSYHHPASTDSNVGYALTLSEDGIPDTAVLLSEIGRAHV